MKAGVLQMTAGIDPAGNAATIVAAVADTAGRGGAMLFTPEMSGLVDRDRARAAVSIVGEDREPVLAAVRDAAARHGTHDDGRTTYGHSLAVDPWGDVLLDMGEAAELAVVDLDPGRLAAVRGRIPALRHRRAIPPVTTA